MNPEHPSVLEPRAEWRRRDFATPESWTERLSANEIEELDAALHHAKSKSTDVLDLARDDFPLPCLGPRLKRIERETAGKSEPRKRELHLLSAGVHAAIMSYVVCAVFSSAQYQWYLFYVVGYALSLRKLHTMERANKVEAVAIEAARADEDGMLWRREAVRG